MDERKRKGAKLGKGKNVYGWVRGPQDSAAATSDAKRVRRDDKPARAIARAERHALGDLE